MGSAPIPIDDPAPSKPRVAAYAVSLFATLGVVGAGAYVAWLPPPPGATGPGMVRVPGGPLTVETELGATTVRIRTLEVDRTEVTAAAYRRCVDAGACKAPTAGDDGYALDCNFDRADRADHPVNCVSVAEAIAYCEWRGARLPTTNEWRYLAHGSGPRRYPWGGEPPDNALLNACGGECGGKQLHPGDDGHRATSPAGAHPAGRTPEGLLDMAGNVEEWACNLDPEQEELDDVACWTFTELGGSFLTATEAELRDRKSGPGRYWRDGYRSPTIGFRCVR
jgi:formylglycine-generating enzyme required for sulfatase activity